MDKFSVKELAALAGVSVRTLHHYDKIGLLQPARRNEKNYRYYGREELLRLQQILLYKEMELPLNEIAAILDEPGFDLLKAMLEHKTALQRRKARMNDLLRTIDKTIDHLKNKTEKMDYNELYKGFSPELAEAYQKEATERWGADKVAAANEKAFAMSKDEWKTLQQKGEDINTALALLMNRAADDEKVQELIAQHYEMMGRYFDVNPKAYKYLGEMYAADERFSAYYDKYEKGLAIFLRDAITIYCAKNT